MLSEQSVLFPTVRSYLGRIKQSEKSGMKAYAKPPTYEVGEITWSASTIWYAGTISHDAYHSFLYHQSKEENDGIEPNPELWTGTEAERKCLEFQLQVLQELLADEHITKYIERLKSDPNYHRIDYKKKNW